LCQYGLINKNYIMENIKIFEKHFRKGMINKDFEAFKRTHFSLLKCILEVMNEVLPQADVIKSVCDQCRFENECRFKAGNVEQNCKFFIDRQTVL
jgi:hypothetical protein